MERTSEELEQEAAHTRAQLTRTLEELRARLTPGLVIDQVVDYAREGPAAEFFRNLGREVRENPLPLVLIGIGIAWLMLASSRSSRTLLANTADTAARKAADIGATASALVSRTSEWGEEKAAQLVDRVSDVTARAADRTREVTGAMTEKPRAASVAHFEMSDEASVREPEAATVCEATRERADGLGLAPESVASTAEEEGQAGAHWQHARAVHQVHEDR